MQDSGNDSVTEADILVVGAGNAALCAAISASENGARVIMIEAAPEDSRGGNSFFTGGAFRFAFNGIEDILSIYPDISEEERKNIDFGSYTEDQYFDDMFDLTEFRTDADLVEILVRGSFETAKWIREQGVRLVPGLGRQAYKVDGKFKFWGGLALHIWGGGPELLKALFAKAESYGVKVLYETPALKLLHDDGGVRGVRVRHQGKTQDITAKAVILACGGFESNAEMRARYLGPNWDLAKVRGTRFNTGKGIEMALDIGALPYGHYSGCHSVAWDVSAPPFGDLTIGDHFQKHNYPYGIIVNANGDRYVDEGADFHSHTYAKYGGEILKQPGLFAWQIFDQRTIHLLRDEYRIRRITKATANTHEELSEKLEGVDPRGYLKTIREFNAACPTDVPFDPNIKDGRRTDGLAINKSNWANPLDTPPYEAFRVTTGVTFTFGGLKIDIRAQVEDTTGAPIPGLFACGELVGGLFYHNYASGTGLMSGAVFGRLAGESASKHGK
ncbi:MAG: FAD-dependent tricarballylate dehydrogenase TcuA [Alphaproteobacteria bacterium]|nr:FAD-dependent tricarballylate dehydrogenase TcuA [Alphaproteobacteria bacterium]